MCTHTAGPWGPVTPRFPLGPSVPCVHTCVVKTVTSAMWQPLRQRLLAIRGLPVSRVCPWFPGLPCLPEVLEDHRVPKCTQP